jgi:hypothetical protein
MDTPATPAAPDAPVAPATPAASDPISDPIPEPAPVEVPQPDLNDIALTDEVSGIDTSVDSLTVEEPPATDFGDFTA